MSLQPSIDLLNKKIRTGDILTPNEMKDLLNHLKLIRFTAADYIPDEKIQSVAFGAAHNVCESGAVNALRHNAAVITNAIRDVLA